MSLIRIEALSLDSAIQLDAEDNRTYQIQGGDHLTVDMARVGDRLIITLVRPAAGVEKDAIHRQHAPTIEEFDRKAATRKRRP